MRYGNDPVRVRCLARWLVASHGKGAEAIALTVVATLVETGQLDYAAMWQQVASIVGTMLGAGSV